MAMTKIPRFLPVGPFNLELCLRVARSFSADEPNDLSLLRAAVRIENKPTILELRQVRRAPAVLTVRTDPPCKGEEMEKTARRIVSAELELLPFYRIAESDQVLKPIIKELHGLKPLRPASLFEMLVIAITEQQISLAAAYRIRKRIIERFGDRVEDLWVFPAPDRLRNCSTADLTACGLSRSKAGYVKGLASRVAEGRLELNRLETMPDEEVRSLLLEEKGLGPWSAEYFLVRGLGRPDRVPADDLGIRQVAGRYLGRGQRLTPLGTRRKLSPFKPYRGLAAFYLLAHDRLSRTPGI